MSILEWVLLCLTLCVGLTAGPLMSRWWQWLVWAFVIFSFGWLAIFFKGTGIIYGVALFSAVALVPPGVFVYRSLPKSVELMCPIFMLAVLAFMWDCALLFYMTL